MTTSRDRDAEQEKIAELRREIAVGIAEANQGKTSPLNAQETLARLRKERETQTPTQQ